MLIDTHSHVNFNAFKDDADEVIRRTSAGGVQMINVGSQYSTSKRAVEMAERYESGVYAAVGLHPIHVNDEKFNYEKFKELTESKKVVAIGEIGLDYFHQPFDKNIQRTGLCMQLDLAKEMNLPVIFHCRNAHCDLINELNNYELRGVVHCFTGSWEDAQKYLEIGLYLGFNGIIFKLKGDETSFHLPHRATSSRSFLDEVIKKMPLERILLETDCPYLVPPEAGVQRNEPLFVKYVAQKIAELKGETIEKISETTTQNAKNLFNI